MIFQKKDRPVSIYLLDSNEVDLLSLEQKFELSTVYRIKTFESAERMFQALHTSPPGKREIPIAVVSFSTPWLEKKEKAYHLLKSLKEVCPQLEVVVLFPPEESEIQLKAIQSGAFTAIRKTENAFLRVQNSIKWIVNRKELKQKRAMAILSLLAFLLLATLTMVIWMLFP